MNPLLYFALYLSLSLLFLAPSFAEPPCAEKFEMSSDGGKMLTKDCCRQLELPQEYVACLDKFGIYVKSREAGHNDSSKDKQFYRCGVTIDWKDAAKGKWVADPANLKSCADERMRFEAECNAVKPKGVILNSSKLGFCSSEYKKHACAMGVSSWCK